MRTGLLVRNLPDSVAGATRRCTDVLRSSAGLALTQQQLKRNVLSVAARGRRAPLVVMI